MLSNSVYKKQKKVLPAKGWQWWYRCWTRWPELNTIRSTKFWKRKKVFKLKRKVDQTSLTCQINPQKVGAWSLLLGSWFFQEREFPPDTAIKSWKTMLKKMSLLRATMMWKGKIYQPPPGLLGHDQEVQVRPTSCPLMASSTRSHNSF